MDRAEIVSALTALAGELEARQVSAEMYVVGGAAIAETADATAGCGWGRL